MNYSVTIKVTKNERQLVYLAGIFTDTNPLVLENEQVISRSSLNLSSGNKSLNLSSGNKSLTIIDYK